METEAAILVWNHVCVPISYKYDVSVLIDDLFEMVEFLLAGSNGDKGVSFPSDTFRVKWNLSVTHNVLRVDSKWLSTVGGTEELLNRNSEITMPVGDFLSEWKSLFAMLLDCLSRAGYEPGYSDETRTLQRLERSIPGTGRLYQS